MYKIEWSKKAFKQLRKIKNRKTRRTIYDAVTELENFPDCRNIRKLSSRAGYRMRVGNWRVFFHKEDMLRIIGIEEVRKRDEHTYR